MRLAEGDVITLDGSEGTVMLGAVPTVDPQLSGDFETLMDWADASRRLKVRTNAETPLDARTAVPVRRRGHRACAAPSTCSSSPTGSSPCTR